MGGSASSTPTPYPPSWLGEGAAEAQLECAATAVRAISSMEPDKFLAARALLPELEITTFDLGAYTEYASAAVEADIGLNRLVYLCVPKRVPEAEFWRCFFCWAHDAVTAVAQPLSRAVLEGADSATTSAIISAFRGDANFDSFSKTEMEGILKRDAEDDEKLAQGIVMAVEKGVLKPNPPVEALTLVDVLGKTADIVAGEIIAALGDAPSNGCVLVMQGLSGTGKGTTVAKLQQLLPRCTAWSNGNVFRSLTLLAVTKCEQAGTPFTSDALNPALLAELVGCLSFGKHGPGGAFDIKISGCGYDVLVSEVANTLLKEPRVGNNIPTVAKMTQGEVIGFAAAAAEAMRADGMNVLMEGRAQTLDYVRTPHRFELTLSEPLIIGMRRAAQRMMGAALEALKRREVADSAAAVKSLLAQALQDEMSKEAAQQPLTRAVLEKADSTTTTAIINAFRGDASFDSFAKSEMEGILKRDAEDDEKLAQGIIMAVEKGVLNPNPPVEALTLIDVLGKTADVVAGEITAGLGDAPSKGCVLVLQGLSGTGKGTTVAKLEQLLPRCTAWSNGNVFRSLTLLAVTKCEQDGTPFASDALTPALLAELVGCLSFGKHGPGGAFDIKISGCGYDVLVSEVANTLLKEPRVGKHIPTVAKMTQGEVIGFAAAAAEAMRADGMNVLMEGRSQTLDYVRTPHRFELTLSEPLIIGMRRAAQRMMGSALETLKKSGVVERPVTIKSLVAQALKDEMSK